ncbi:MAG: D-alanyl-D-alanine carboxypeptidase family protein [Patescibacteria group bacterium]
MLESLFLLLGLSAEPAFAPPALEHLMIHPVPQLTELRPAPIVDAASALVLDLGSGKILFEKNSQDARAIASLTKLMTAVVARENFDLTEVVTVSKDAAAQPPAKIWLRAGEKITVENLLKATLMESGNDAALSLAEHKYGVAEFVEKMNRKVAALGLQQTHFTNPIGYDDPENYGTAYDLALLSGYVLRDPLLKEIAATQRDIITDTQQTNTHHLLSTNILFNTYLDIRGLKTGSTDAAGECLAAIAQNENGNNVLAIVLDSPNRFQEAKIMLNWAIENFRW